MKKHFFLLIIFITFNSFSQTTPNSFSENSAIVFHFGTGIHGTGDTPGFNYGFNYKSFFQKNLFWNVGFEGTLHDSKQRAFIWEAPNGNVFDSTLHDVTAGFQLVLGIGYHIINSTHHKFGINLNALGRYQASSLNDLQETQYPLLTGYPVPIRFIINTTPSRTLAFGGAIKLFYDYKFENKYSIGLMGAFQMDTNGDVIPYAAIRLGRYF